MDFNYKCIFLIFFILIFLFCKKKSKGKNLGHNNIVVDFFPPHQMIDCFSSTLDVSVKKSIFPPSLKLQKSIYLYIRVDVLGKRG